MLELAVGGGDDAYIDLDGAVAADAFEFAFLQHAQQLALKRQGQLADFVEENGAAVSELESPFALVRGAGEGTFFVAEEFALDKVFGQRSTVELDERAVLAGGVAMHGAGDEFLAGAVLALNENGGVSLGDAADELAHLLGGSGSTEDFALGIFAAILLSEELVDVEHLRKLVGLVQDDLDLFVGEGLEKIIEGAVFHTLRSDIH